MKGYKSLSKKNKNYISKSPLFADGKCFVKGITDFRVVGEILVKHILMLSIF